MPTLFIRALSAPRRLETGLEFSCEWLIVDQTGRKLEYGSEAFAGLAGEPEHWTPFWRTGDSGGESGLEPTDGSASNEEWARNPGNVVVLAPGEHVLSVSCQVPGRSVGQMRRALPYAVEEFIAGEIERTHLANGPMRRGQPVHCGLIDEGILEDWLECLAALGIRPGHLVSEAELLPVEPGSASVLIENGHAVLRTLDQAATIDRGNLVPVLTTLDLDKLTVIDGSLSDIETSQLDMPIERNDADVLQRGGEGAVLAWFAEIWRERRRGLNLLQGNYAPETPEDADNARWRGVAALGAAWLLLAFLGMTATGIWSSIQADALEGEALVLYRSVFPGDRTATIQNVRRRMQARLGERPAAAGKRMIGFTGDLAAVMDASMTLVGMDYNEARGDFATEMFVKRYDDVDRVRAALEARGLQAEIASAEQVEQGVRARLRLRGG